MGIKLFIYDGSFKNDGARYDPAADSWTPMGATGALPSARQEFGFAWAGTHMMITGGWNGGELKTGPMSVPSV